MDLDEIGEKETLRSLADEHNVRATVEAANKVATRGPDPVIFFDFPFYFRELGLRLRVITSESPMKNGGEIRRTSPDSDHLLSPFYFSYLAFRKFIRSFPFCLELLYIFLNMRRPLPCFLN